jgi:CRISPR/Cas system-associated exonuclease Cas4 (RecB family)
MKVREINYVSPSQLAMFTTCPRKWWALYSGEVEVVKEPPTAAQNMGLAAHKILELSLKARIKGITSCMDPFKIIPYALKKYPLEGPERDMIPTLIQNAEHMGWYDRTDEKVKVEEKINYLINGKIKIGGRADKLELGNKYTRIVDLKSGKSPYDPQSLRKNWQAMLYSLPFLEEGKRAQAEFWFIRYKTEKQSVVFFDQDKPMIEKRIIEVVDKMEETTGSNYCKNNFCKWCPFYTECKKMKGKEIRTWKET